MINKNLKEQVLACLNKEDLIPEEWEKFVHEINGIYVGLEKEGVHKGNLLTHNITAINELNNQFITEAEDLKKAHSELERILNSVNYGFFSRNIFTDNYTYLSQACEGIYGYASKEFCENNRLWFEVIYPEDRSVVERDNVQLRNNEKVYTQYRIIAKDKSLKWIELTLIPFLKENRLTRVDGVVNDITKRKAAENEREVIMEELMKTNADFKQFSYITSHNLRSPLSNIQGILNLFDFDEKDVHNRQMLDMLKVSAQQLEATIADLNQILVIKNNVNLNPTYLILEDSFKKVIQTFNSAINEIGGKVMTDFKSPIVMLNKIYLESIFINLISNAIKYRSPDRLLVLQVETSEEENSYVKMKFSDNGMGIDLNRHKDKVFGLYQRFHEGIDGQGMGLFIMKSQVEASGGKIVIESEPGVGTTFILTLKR